MAIVITAQDFVAQKFSSGKNSLGYRFFSPKNLEAGKKYPLMLSLHGAGERGSDNQKHLDLEFTRMWADETIQSPHPCFVVVPQCALDEQWVNVPWGKGSYAFDSVPISEYLQGVVNLLAHLKKEFPVDLSRIYLSGVSMGGYGAWYLLMAFPKLFAAAVVVCGAGDPNLAKSIAEIPTWVFHGSNDNIVPVSGSREMVQALQAVGGQVKYTELSGVEHDSWIAAARERELVGWLFNQSRVELE